MHLTAADRLTLNLRICDGLALVDKAITKCPAFLCLQSQHQVLVLMDVWLDEPPLLNGEKITPRAINWDKLFEFLEMLLPILLRIWGL